MELAKLNVVSLDAYLESIRGIPAIEREEEFRLFEEYRNFGNMLAVQRIILGNLRFVWYIVKGYKGYGISLEDLIQEGNVGLMRAVKGFDHSRGIRFVTYAVAYIRNEVINYIIANFRKGKIITTKQHKKLFFGLSKYNRIGSFSDREINRIVDELGVAVADVRHMERVMYEPEIELDKVMVEGDTDVYSDILLCSSEQDPVNILEADDAERLRLRVLELVQTLDDRDLDIIQSRYLTDKPVPRKKLAIKYGISQQRIEQIEKEIFVKIKDRLDECD